MSVEILTKARQVADYVAARRWFASIEPRRISPVSTNIAAVLFDAVFQAGLNYRTVVLPRVRSIEQRFPNLTCLSDLAQIIDSPEFSTALNWRHEEKPKRLRCLVCFLRTQGLETVSDLREWLANKANRTALLNLRGIGNKTVDYLARLTGFATIAVDRHVRRLLQLVGIVSQSYAEAKRVIEFAADLLNIDRWSFDKLIWEQFSTAVR
ncbi:hypothetical protein OPIT5_22340 [Opitutaceae bacterium TAV5]|nr:hypothetical protein OPIT5_22340 [Opitutaceae bacterium TAV5]